MSEPRCYFFGCWNQPGHFMHGPGSHNERDRVSYCDKAQTIHLDGTLAPRSKPGTRLLWRAQFKPNSREWHDQGGEYPQGQFLRHELETGFTALQWWDRCQGDTRGACNSTVLLEGVHDTATMLAALERHYPHVLANLRKHGVELVEVSKEDQPLGRWYSQTEVDAARASVQEAQAEIPRWVVAGLFRAAELYEREPGNNGRLWDSLSNEAVAWMRAHVAEHACDMATESSVASTAGRGEAGRDAEKEQG